MDDVVMVAIPVSGDAAEVLKKAENRERIGRLVSNILRPGTTGEDPIVALIADLKAEARAAGLTDADIDAELAAYNAERRI
jgi:hypothetical protein